jgi:hypothetical protein
LKAIEGYVRKRSAGEDLQFLGYGLWLVVEAITVYGGYNDNLRWLARSDVILF